MSKSSAVSVPEPIDILIVDDREDGLLALEVVLSSPRLNILKAQSGEAALVMVEQHDVGVIIMDVQMPGLDGFQTAELIRKQDRHHHTPIIFVTAINKDDRYVYKGYEAGAVDYVFKPFDPHILRSKVSVFVELFEKNRQLERQAEMIRQSERRERYTRLAELEVESLRRYRNLADAIPHIVWKANAEGHLVYVNRRWTDYTGLSLEQSQGLGWQGSIEPEDLGQVLKFWLKAMADKQPFESEVRIRRQDGGLRWHLLRFVPERRNAEVVAWIGTCTELHDRKIMEERLVEAQIQAEAASLAKTNFLANVSHEIRTPLNAILGFTELILSPDQDPEENTRSLAVIRRSGRQLLRLIDDILDISKVEAGHLRVEMIEVDVPVLLDEVRSFLQLQAQEKGLLLKFSLSTPIPKRIISDPTRLKQILVNLIGNAVKFTHKGQVSVDVAWNAVGVDSGTGVQFRITDTGTGIDSSKVDCLFKPFAQVDSSMTRKFGGTGLGLALSKRLAQMMGGDVRLESSTPGSGSVFVAEIRATVVDENLSMVKTLEPIIRDTLKQEFVEGRGSARLDGLRVLVADDSSDNVTLVTRFLKSAGADVDVAGNGLEAIEKISASDYQVVLMDIQMPYLDGYEATERLRLQGYKGPIVALTAHALKEERERCLQVGCTSHLTKPIEKKILIDHVASLVGLES